MTRLALLASITLLTAGCAGDRTATDDTAPPASAESATGAASATGESPVTASPQTVTSAPPRSTGAEQVPTAADSAAALAEDVSPEWKMRTRQMAPFADCMEKTQNAPADIRPTLVDACHRLPDAPKRP